MGESRRGEDVGIEGLMRGLKLTEEERQGVKVAWKSARKEAGSFPQAVGKLFSSKAGSAEWLEQGVGKIWCPRARVRCRDLGDNFFLFTFLQPGGKRWAIMEGPWELGNDLLIAVEYDESKRLRELEFRFIPVWLRFYDLPLGLMKEKAGRLMGSKVGEVLEVEADEDGSAVGSCMRVKVCLDVQKPLARGVLVEDEEGEGIWCKLKYEFLPNFCYICGLLGHVDKECDESVGKGEERQYGEYMCFNPQRKKVQGEFRGRWSGSSGSGGSSQARGSDGPWRKPEKEKSRLSEAVRGSSQITDPELRDDGQSPLKQLKAKEGGGVPRKLSFESAGSSRQKELRPGRRDTGGEQRGNPTLMLPHVGEEDKGGTCPCKRGENLLKKTTRAWSWMGRRASRRKESKENSTCSWPLVAKCGPAQS